MGFVMSLAVLIVSLLGVVSPAAVPLILDTDMGGGGCRDVDDVAALCMDYDGYMNMKSTSWYMKPFHTPLRI